MFNKLDVVRFQNPKDTSVVQDGTVLDIFAGIAALIEVSGGDGVPLEILDVPVHNILEVLHHA